MRNIANVVRVIPGHRSFVSKIFLLSLIVSLTTIAIPLIFRFLINQTEAAKKLAGAVDDLLVISAIIIAVACVRLVSMFGNYALECQSEDLWREGVTTLRARVLHTMAGLPIEFYDSAKSGDMVERFNAVPMVVQWLFLLTEGTLTSIFQAVLAWGILLFKSPLAAVLVLALLPVAISISTKETKLNRPLRKEQATLVGSMSAIVSEMSSHIFTIRGLSGEGALFSKYRLLHGQWDRNFSAIRKRQRSANLQVNFLVSTITVFSMALLAGAAITGSYSAGDTLLVFVLLQLVINAIVPVSQFSVNTAEAEVQASRLSEVLNLSEELDTGRLPITEFEYLEFRDVWLKYPGCTNFAISGLSFSLKRGQVTALVGSSGAGKSSVVKLLLGIYRPTSGSILLNGRDIREFRSEDIRSLFGLVPQEILLFNDTIEHNISLSSAPWETERVKTAANIALVDDFITALPNGYNSVVGERGANLSGGERQRIAIARAVFKGAPVLVFDEATSALDVRTEEGIYYNLKALGLNRTVLHITHKKQTASQADNILVLRDGKLVESGSHTYLSNNGGDYAHQIFSFSK